MKPMVIPRQNLNENRHHRTFCGSNERINIIASGKVLVKLRKLSKDVTLYRWRYTEWDMLHD